MFRLQHFPTRDRSGKDLGKYVARLITSRNERHKGLLFVFFSFRLLLEFLVQLVRRRERVRVGGVSLCVCVRACVCVCVRARAGAWLERRIDREHERNEWRL